MVAVAGGRVGGIVTADQRRIWNVEVVAGVVANLGIAKGLVIVEVGANHLEEQAGRTVAGRVGRVARPQPSVGRPVAIALVEFDGDHLPGTEGAASRKAPVSHSGVACCALVITVLGIGDPISTTCVEPPTPQPQRRAFLIRRAAGRAGHYAEAAKAQGRAVVERGGAALPGIGPG